MPVFQRSGGLLRLLPPVTSRFLPVTTRPHGHKGRQSAAQSLERGQSSPLHRALSGGPAGPLLAAISIHIPKEIQHAKAKA